MRWLAGAVVLGVLVVAAPATAAVTIGPKPLPERKGVFGGKHDDLHDQGPARG